MLKNGDLFNCWNFQQDTLIYMEVIKKNGFQIILVMQRILMK